MQYLDNKLIYVVTRFSDKNKILKSVKGKLKLQVSRKKTFPPFCLKKASL